jgi:hypothetical protein
MWRILLKTPAYRGLLRASQRRACGWHGCCIGVLANTRISGIASYLAKTSVWKDFAYGEGASRSYLAKTSICAS